MWLDQFLLDSGGSYEDVVISSDGSLYLFYVNKITP